LQSCRKNHVFRIPAQELLPEYGIRDTEYGFVLDQKKLFWIILTLLSLILDFVLPLMWGLIATIPLVFVCWWIVYRSGWV